MYDNICMNIPKYSMYDSIFIKSFPPIPTGICWKRFKSKEVLREWLERGLVNSTLPNLQQKINTTRRLI